MADLSVYAKWFSPRGGGALRRDQALVGQLTGQWSQEDGERKAAQRLSDWYLRKRPEIEKHIKKQASITFGDRTTYWQTPLINGVARTVRRISMTYRRPPQRKYFIGEKELVPGSEELKKIERMFTRSPYRRPNLDKPLREADRWSTLFNTTHLEVVYRNGQIEWDLRRRPEVMVIEDPANGQDFIMWARRLSFIVDKKTIGGFLVWTPDEHVFVRDDGYVYAVSTPDGSNPFTSNEVLSSGIPVPVVTVRKSECDDYWGRYGADIVDCFEQACIQLGATWEDAFMQGGVPILTNTGLGNNQGKRVTVSLKDPITVEKVTKDDLAPNLEFKRPDTPIEKLQGLIDWYVKMGGASYGQPPNAWAQDEKVMSGFAKLIDNVELLEDRDERVPDSNTTEEQLFEFSKLMWNRMHPIESEHVHPDARVETVFQEVEFPESPAEEALAAASEIQANLSSPVDFIMKKRKISSRDEAMKVAIEIVEENAKLKKAYADIIGPMPGELTADDDEGSDEDKPPFGKIKKAKPDEDV